MLLPLSRFTRYHKVRTAAATFASASDGKMVKTSLYDLHLQIGGKMVPFAGYELPVQYDGLGVLKEHLHTRALNSASLFDVSHMGQIKWHGKDAVKFIEKLCVSDIKSLKVGEAKLSLIMNEKGTIVDDTVITNAGDYIYMVVNGACKYKDMDHFENYIKSSGLDVQMEYLGDQQLIALQGKGAKTVIGRLVPNLDLVKMNFMTGVDTSIAGIESRITRCGYTGEDGFEISVAPGDAVKLASLLLEQPEVKPAGLGARDSLRLEAGLCLYGNDLDETITPIEGALTWTIGGPKSRRRLEQGFLGAEAFLLPGGQLKPIQKKRVGLADMRAPARAPTEIFSADGSKKIGSITSGGFGPSLQKPIVVKTPFFPTDYYRAP
eukprot:gene28196-37099_t